LVMQKNVEPPGDMMYFPSVLHGQHPGSHVLLGGEQFPFNFSQFLQLPFSGAERASLETPVVFQ